MHQFFLAAILLSSVSSAGAQLVDTVFARYQTQVERSVERGLAYLAAAQKEDGTFAGTYGKSTGIVSLVGMSFLSKGHLPGDGRYGTTLNRCIDYVLASQKPDGLLVQKDSGHGPMYAHNISTLFLSEVSGMVDPSRQALIHQALARATKLLLDAQAVPKSPKNRGGWRYKPDSTDSDLSCSGWAFMALKSARLNGARVPDAAIESAVAYVLRNHDQTSGTFGYTDTKGHAETLTGCGILCLELSGFHGADHLDRAGDQVLASCTLLPSKDHQFYANYYNAQAMFQLGGHYWERYAKWMYQTSLARQIPDGSWVGKKYGTAYTTSMILLSFTVPYRQLPIYQRDETVDE